MKFILCCFAFTLPFLAYGQPATPYTRIEENGKFGCLDANQRLVFPCEYDDILHFWVDNGSVPVRKGNFWGLADPFNQLLLPIEYRKIEKDGNRYILTDREGRVGMAKLDGSLFIPCRYERGSMELSIKAVKMYRNDTVFVFDQEGNVLFQNNYNDIRGTSLQQDLLAAQKEGRWGLMNLSEKVLIPFEYQDIQFSNNLLSVDGKKVHYLKVKNQNNWGILDLQGNQLLPFAWQSVEMTSDGRYFIVYLNGECSVLNRNAETVISPGFKEISYGGKGRFWVRNHEGLMGLWSENGEIIPDRYLQRNLEIESETVRVKEADKKTLYSLTGAFEPFVYTDWSVFSTESRFKAIAYLLPDGRKCLITSDNTSPPAEIYEEATPRNQLGYPLVILRNTDAQGKKRFGIREAQFGRCIAPIVYAELDFNVTQAHQERFSQSKDLKSRQVVALGRLEERGKWVMIGSQGDVVE